MLGVWIEQRLHRDRRNGGAAAVNVAEERSQAEAALAFAAAIVESSDDAIVGMTLYGMITSWNAGAERLYGYTAREVFGRWPVGITIPEDELPKILKRVGRGQRVNPYESGLWMAAFDPGPSLSEHRLSLPLSVRQGGGERRCPCDVDHLFVPNL